MANRRAGPHPLGRFSLHRRALLAISLVAAHAVSAQQGVAREGALFLLLPLGARLAASGQSVASPEPSSEQLYWNPAGIARATSRELAFNYGKFYIGPLVAGAVVWPLGRAGVVGATAAVLDYGTQETGDINATTGSISQQSYILGATYAATLGRRVNVGFSFKSAQFVGNCSGYCPPLAIFHVSSSAVDAGVQYRALKDDDLIIALALRHAGLSFQVNDEPQADPLPTRIQFGASYRVRVFDDDLPGSRLRVSADVIDRALQPGSAAARFGVDLSWRDQIGVRAGYVSGSGEGTGLGVGIGVASGRVAVDVGQAIGGTGDVARSSTYLTVRYRW